MKAKKTPTWLVLGVLGAGMIPLAVLGIYTYTTATAPVLHPDPEAVSSVARPEPSPAWVGAVTQARQIARAALVEQNLPGLSVAVGAAGSLVWAEGLGWADLEHRVVVEPETRFRIGTASQVLTSAGAGVLLEKGTLTLDEKIQTYVPQFPAKQWPVTLRHLMGHMSGVRNDAGDEEPVTVRCERTLDVLPRFAESALRFEPGTEFRPSSYGWVLVSAAIEAASGEAFFSFMRSQVFDPIGMHDTRADSGTESSAKRAVDYFPRFASDPRYGPQEPSEEDHSCFSGAGAFLSTPSDMVRFGLALNGGTFLQPSTVRLLQTSQRLASGQETGYGLGWDRRAVTLAGRPVTTAGHEGALRGGSVSTFITFPETGLVVSVISNTAYADTSSVAVRIAEVFGGRGSE